MLIFERELTTIPEYSSSIPTATTLWKVWKRDFNFNTFEDSIQRGERELLRQERPKDWVVCRYEPHKTKPNSHVNIAMYEVVLLSGPWPFEAFIHQDWDNAERWQAERIAHLDGKEVSNDSYRGARLRCLVLSPSGGG